LKGKELAQLALENKKQSEALGKDINELRDKTDIETRRLQYDVYQPKIRDIEEECRTEVKKVQDAALALHNLKVEQVKTLMIAVHTVERILEFFRLDTKQDLKTTDEDVKYSDRHQHYYRENLGVVFSDQYLEVRLFILQNDKPTNKYMLVLIGRCLFDNGLGDSPLLKLPRDYSINGAAWGACPQQILKEASDVKDLHTWWTAHGFSKVNWLKDYLTVKSEYEHILKTYKVEDFKDFLTWMCPKCDYFNTVFESYYQRDGEVQTCPRCEDKTPMAKLVTAKQQSLSTQEGKYGGK